MSLIQRCVGALGVIISPWKVNLAPISSSPGGTDGHCAMKWWYPLGTLLPPLSPTFFPSTDRLRHNEARPCLACTHARTHTLTPYTHTLSPSKVFLYWSSHHSILALQLRLVILPGVLHDSSNWCVNMMSEFLPLYDLRRQFKCVWCRFLIVPMLISWMRSPFFFKQPAYAAC